MNGEIEPEHSPGEPKQKTVQELKQIAEQLRKPEGQAGREVAEAMNKSNASMTKAAFDALGVVDGDHVLEVGFGNGDHVAELMQSANGLRYSGIDISTSMLAEAEARNAALVKADAASFYLGDGERVDLPAASFQRVFTVNTIYFWEDPVQYLREIERVMAPGAVLCIAFAKREFMENLSFTKWGFTFFDDEDISDLADATILSVHSIEHHSDLVEDKSGTRQNRTFAVAKLIKPHD